MAGQVLRFVPFLRMAALNGSIVRGEENKQSDIDILIIACAGRLYTCRAFASALIHLTGWRRHGKKISGRICLNCYLSDQYLDIFPENKTSAYKVAKAYKSSIALVDEGLAQKFQIENSWFEKFEKSSNTHTKLLQEACFIGFPLKPSARLLEKMLLGKVGNFVERRLMQYQQSRILRGKRKGDEIYASEKAIKLHPKKY